MFGPQVNMFFRTGLIIIGLLFIFTTMGCSPSVGQVSGKVTFKGVPLTSGSIKFVYKDGQEVGSPIIADGYYCIKNAPPGDVQIAIDSPFRLPPAFHPDAPKENSIPARYKKAKESGLTYTVKKGQQPHNIDLLP